MANGNFGGFWIRFVALVIDCVIVGTLSWGAAVGFDIIQPSPPEIAQFIANAFQVIFSLGYFWILQTRMSGTPGKRLLGLRLVNSNFNRPTYRQGFIRWLMTIPSALVFCLGYILAARHPKKQGWHDRVAGTYVIRGRPASEQPARAAA